MSYYQRDLAFIHDRGYGLHADRCAPGILELLSGVGHELVLEFGCGSGAQPPFARVEDDWAIITAFATPAPDRVVRDITTFVPDGAGAWRRGRERHENVLVDTSRIPTLLARHGVRASVGTSFGDAELPAGLRSVIGRKE